MSKERTPEEKLQLELDEAKGQIRRLEQQNEKLRCKLAWVAAYCPLPRETSV